MSDNVDRLCLAVYGRQPRARDYLGGAEARFLADAAGKIESLESIIRETLASRERAEAELADVRHSEARYRDDRDEAIRMRHHAIEARVAAVKRAKRAEAEVTRLRAALADACELAEEGWSYAGDYFRDKWGYAERMAAARAALGAVS